MLDELPSHFVNDLVSNIVSIAKAAEAERDKAAVAYTLTEEVSQRNHALYANAKYDTCRDILLMLGKHSALKSGEPHE